jgi:hypothetical protein
VTRETIRTHQDPNFCSTSAMSASLAVPVLAKYLGQQRTGKPNEVCTHQRVIRTDQ